MTKQYSNINYYHACYILKISQREHKCGISKCKLAHPECINNKALLYSTGNYIHYPVIKPQWKRVLKKKVHMYICVCLLIVQSCLG